MTPMTFFTPARGRLARGPCLAGLATMAALGWTAAPAASPVGSPAANDPHRGGTLRLLAGAGAGTIDPQIN